MQAEVEQKAAVADKYQRLLQASQSELQAAAEAHKTEVSSLMKQLHTQTDSAFSKVCYLSLAVCSKSRIETMSDV